MKKFITVIPLQIRGGLKSYVYKSTGNRHLVLDDAVSFPIIHAIKGYVAPDEDYQVIPLIFENEDSANNYDTFKTQIDGVTAKYGIKTPEYKPVLIPSDESVSAQLDTFKRLLEYIDDEDQLYACITYGTKPLPITVLTVLKYAYKIKKNTSIDCIVYGKVNRNSDNEDWTAEIYDMTALVKVDEIINKLSAMKVEDPEKTIRMILDL